MPETPDRVSPRVLWTLLLLASPALAQAEPDSGTAGADRPAESRPSEQPSSRPGASGSEAGPVLAAKAKERLSGPPIVSAKAWAIADGQTGDVLWSHGADRRLPMASITKLMTALLVARLAERNEKLLAERVRISVMADVTGGSSSRLRAGEQLAVRDLLHGLLLPSGNDAANALAEHFGGYFRAPPRTMFWPRSVRAHEKPPAWRAFVAEMNRTAKALGLKRTRFYNPHGLDCIGHRSTPEDLLRLARVVLREPLLRKYVATRQHRAKVFGADGSERDVVWRNTNRLLDIEGYDGLKTGTTRNAGACLLSSCKRGKDRLLIVVLGSTSSQGRYVDTRNLSRWAFLELGHKD